jgi:hypothetical protein
MAGGFGFQPTRKALAASTARRLRDREEIRTQGKTKDEAL